MSVERFLRHLHSWLGALILPWVVLAGLTGFYMNHEDLVLSALPSANYDPALFDAARGTVPQTESSARVLAELAMPGAELTLTSDISFLKRPVFTFDAGDTDVIVDRATGHYWVQSRYRRSVYAPDGELLQSAVRWGRVLSSWHGRGWIGTGLGTWPADITAFALMAFGLSGIYLFVAPRLRRWKNKRARLAFQRAQVKPSSPSSPSA